MMNGEGFETVDGFMNLQGFMHQLAAAAGGDHGPNLQGLQLAPATALQVDQQQSYPPNLAAPANNSGSGATSTNSTAIRPGAATAAAPSRYESQKRRDWNTFGQYLRNHRPPLALAKCSGAHVLEFLRYLDQFGKTKVHTQGCPFFGLPQPPSACACPLRQAWGSLDALIGRLRAAFEENGGKPESNPFGARAVRLYLRDVRETQAKARGIAYEKKKRKRPPPPGTAAVPGAASACGSSMAGGDHHHHHHQASISTSASSSTSTLTHLSSLPSHAEAVYSSSSVAAQMGMNHHDNIGGAAGAPLLSSSLGIPHGPDHAYHHHHLPQAPQNRPSRPPPLIPSFN